MRLDLRSLAIAFVAGLIGWLAVSALHLTGEPVFFAAFLIGAIAGMLTGRPAAIAGLVAGILAAYPLALAMGSIVFLGESWATYAAVAAAVGAAGFLVSSWVASRSRLSRRAPGRVVPSSDIQRR